MKPLRTFEPTSTEVQELQRNADDCLRPLYRLALLDGRVVEGVDVSTGVAQVSHGLGRKPLGFFVVDATADVRVWRDGDADTRLLPLRASVSGRVSLFVY